MAEYIEREAAINEIEEWYDMYPESDVAREALSMAKRAILKIPAADVRPVVLCRDCDCWNDWDSAGRESLGNYVCSCAHWTVEDGAVFYTRPTDFCSYGERREES